jgi:WD40 repeat protein
MVFSQNDLLFSGGRDALLKVWKLDQTPILLETINAHWFTINDLQISPNGNFLISASRDKTIKIWDIKTLELLKVLDRFKNIGGHTHSVNRLLWLDNETFVSGGDDKKICVWKME